MLITSTGTTDVHVYTGAIRASDMLITSTGTPDVHVSILEPVTC
jgi:hypothetical protein